MKVQEGQGHEVLSTWALVTSALTHAAKPCGSGGCGTGVKECEKDARKGWESVSECGKSVSKSYGCCLAVSSLAANAIPTRPVSLAASVSLGVKAHSKIFSWRTISSSMSSPVLTRHRPPKAANSCCPRAALLSLHPSLTFYPYLPHTSPHFLTQTHTVCYPSPA